MKIICVVPNIGLSASEYWRVTSPMDAITNDVDSNFEYVLTTIEDSKNVDMTDALIYVHRVIPFKPTRAISLLRKAGAKKIVYSVDDLTFREQPFEEYLRKSGGMLSVAITSALTNVGLQRETMELCDAIVTTTDELADQVMAYTKCCSVWPIPNAIDERYFMERLDAQPKYQNQGDFVYVGWAGGRRPQEDLSDMAIAWKIIAERYSNVKFVVAGWQPDIIYQNIDLDRIIRIPWATLDEWPKSMQVDIGCCSLSPSEFNKGKSNIKYQEYTVAGAATIVTPTVYGESTFNSHNSLIANNIEEWVEYLERLIKYKDIRHRIRDVAYYETHNYNSLESIKELWIESFNMIMDFD